MTQMPTPSISFMTNVLFWIFIAAVFCTFLWIFKTVLMPFVLGFAIAYLLNPFIVKMEAMNFSRKSSSLLILSIFFIVIGLFLIVVSPILIRELIEFSNELPLYFNKIQHLIYPFVERIQNQFGWETKEDLITIFQPYMAKMVQTSAVAGTSVLQHLASGGVTFFNFILTLFLTPIVAYFLLKEWPKITDWIYSLMPKDHENTLKGLLSQIDTKLSGFIRGQLSVCAVLGILYAVALMIAGLKYGFFIGLLAGALSIIPLLGSVVGLLVSVMVAWFQSGELSYVGIIAAIFFVGQIIEGNFLTPKLVGDSVGLHPLWVLFALMAGGAVFGILGMMLAVPIAAIAGVLIGFFILKYKKSPFYKKHPVAKKPSKKTLKSHAKK